MGEKSGFLRGQFSSKRPRPTALVVVWRREETRRVRCTAPWTQASEDHADCLLVWPRRDMPNAPRRVKPFLGISYLTMWLRYESTSTYPRRGGRRVRLSWSLGLSPRQPTLVGPRRDAPPRRPPTACRARRNVAIQLCHHPTRRVSIVLLLLLAIVDNIWNS